MYDFCHRRIAIAVAAFLTVALFTGGCVLPVPLNAPKSHGLLEESVLKSLVGLNQREVSGRLGEPIRVITGPNETYHLYEGRDYPGTTLIVDRVYLEQYRVRLHCYLLVIDQTEKVARYKIETGYEQEDSYTVNDQFGRSVTPPRGPERDCTDFLWTQKEFEKLAKQHSAAEKSIVVAKLKGKLASGDYEAALELARTHKNFDALHRLAEKGRKEAGYDLFLLLNDRQDTVIEAFEWLCRAANLGYAKAQSEIAYWHRNEVWASPGLQTVPIRKAGLTPDNRVAYMWLTIAAKNGDENALTARKYISGLTDEEIAIADRWARNWKPGQCPRPSAMR